MIQKDIKEYSLEDLKFYLTGIGEKAYKANQIFEWLYLHGVSSFDSMTNLSKYLRKTLSETFVIRKISLIFSEKAYDETKKYIFKTLDGSCFETVGIPTEKFLTVCVSSQIGCPMKCAFCATGQQGLTRNLNIGEIVDQVLEVQKDFKRRVTNVVVMGQGEPFLNYKNLIAALDILNDSKGIAIGARKITVSTSGLLKGIKEFCKIPKQYGLAVSLHSAVQETRDKLMPGVKNQTLNDLNKTLKECSNRRVSFEYLLLKNINDDSKHLNALLEFCKNINCHINLLRFNKVPNSFFEASDKFTLWQKTLRDNNIETTIRRSRGEDINGACGQLVSRETF